MICSKFSTYLNYVNHIVLLKQFFTFLLTVYLTFGPFLDGPRQRTTRLFENESLRQGEKSKCRRNIPG